MSVSEEAHRLALLSLIEIHRTEYEKLAREFQRRIDEAEPIDEKKLFDFL